MVNTTKKALLMSAVSLLLCFAMLLGTTFAWFTDSAASASNVITSGSLDVEVEYSHDGTNWSDLDGANDLFKATDWEPGHTQIVAIKVTNKGNLALKYMANMNMTKEFVGKTVGDADIKLSDILTVESLVTKDLSVVQTALSGDSAIPGADKASFKDTDILANSKTLLRQGEFDYILVKVDMPETIGNEANHNGIDVPAIEFGLNFVATQFTYEEDSFGPNYDVDSKYPAVGAASVPAGTIEATLITAGDVSVYIPAMANEGEYKLEVESKSVETTADGTVAAFDIELTCDGQKVTGTTYPVSIQIGKMLDVKSLKHNGNAIADYTYNAMTGVISFTTTSFSPFEVVYSEIKGAVVENGKITGGTFDINPVTLDASLAEADSEYIAIDYTLGGATKYVVAQRSETVVLSASDDDVTPVNGNYQVTEGASGKLWSIIKDLQNNEHSTVYLLPGTYNEGTTIYIYSSMDIIGLGDKDSVKVVKQSSSDSNRHLFNASGTKADYIQVTLSNLYLDATAKTTGGKDNAAVQSIRKSKVKCYDLTIVKENNMAYKAFYVNGNNAVDGVKYPAYMYVENCNLNVTSTISIVDTAGTYKFYHSGLTYNSGTLYTANSGSKLNQTMAADDWEW